jgi:hypothetical protein
MDWRLIVPDRFTSRRFILALFIVALTGILTWFAKIGDQVYSAVIITTITAIVIGNTTIEVKKLSAPK